MTEEKKEWMRLLRMARERYPWKVVAFQRKKELMRREMGLSKDRERWSEEDRKRWNARVLETRRELDKKLVERLKCEIEAEAKRAQRNVSSEELLRLKEEKRLEREELKRVIKEKYGFTLGKKPVTPEEIEGRRRYELDKGKEMREKKREEIRIYNRQYRRKKRAEALKIEQQKWSSEQWAEYKRRMANKGKGSPNWLVRRVVRDLAQTHNMTEDEITERLIELGGIDFLVGGAESIGKERCANKSMLQAAIRALALYLDPETAEMFGAPEA